MSDVKLCRDCRYCVIKHTVAFCEAPQGETRVPDFVNGGEKVTRAYSSCDVLREHDMAHMCGPAAKWFEPKVVQGAVA